jgi:hypothetical protein
MTFDLWEGLWDRRRRAAKGETTMEQSTNGKHRNGSVGERAAAPAAAVRLYAQLGLRVPEELAVRLKAHCRASGKSMNRTVMEALNRYLGDKGR